MFRSMVAKQCALMWRVKKLHILSQAEYRFSFLFQLFAMFFNDSVLLLVWGLFFKTFPTLNGWDFETMLLFISIQWGGATLFLLIAGGVANLPLLITSGRLDYYLAFPQNPLFFISIEHLFLPDIVTLLMAVAVWIYCVGFSIFSFLLFFILCSSASIVVFSFNVIIASLGFYVGNAEYLFEILLSAFFNIAYFPQSVYPRWIKLITTFIIPVFFMAILPTALAQNFSWQGLGLLFGAAVIFFLFAIFLFNRGLRRYESGNVLQLKM